MRCILCAAAVVLVGCGGAVSDPYSSAASGLSVCAGAATVSGLDVSKYEGSIDWPTVKASGVGFAIARVSDGLNFPDATFDTNWAAMKSVGLVRGAYQYFEPALDPVAQANLVLQHVGTLGPGDLAPVIDVETMGGQSASVVLAGVEKWLATIQAATGRRPIVYASPSFWDGLGNPSVAADLWIANWQVACPSIPAPWSGWRFWQSSATGKVAGVPVSAVDLDTFNGSMSDLLTYAGSPPPAATITSPATGATVSGTVQITVSANSSAIKVELYVDSTLLATATSAAWDTTKAADGAHQLTAKAYDSSGASTVSPAVDVTVSNSGGTTCSGFLLGASCPPPTGCASAAGGMPGLFALLAGALVLAMRRRLRA